MRRRFSTTSCLLATVAVVGFLLASLTPATPVTMETKGVSGGDISLEPSSNRASQSGPNHPLSENSRESCPTAACAQASSASDSALAGSPSWTNLTNPNRPPWANDIAMTFDNASQSVLLFGSTPESNGLGNGTWAFSSGTWKDLTSTAGDAPPTQQHMAMTYDAHDGYVLMFGCLAGVTSSGLCNDTWDFSGGSWHFIHATNPPSWANVSQGYEYEGVPYDLPSISAVYDSPASDVVMTNGFDTWDYSGGVWTPLCLESNCSTGFIPGPDLFGVATYDAHDGYVLFVGSKWKSESLDGGSWTWTFQDGRWTNISATAGTAPSARIGFSMAYDSSSGNVLLFGGTNSSGARLNDTWTFQSGTWTQLSPAMAPQPRTFAMIADDPQDSLVLLFGGVAPPAEIGSTTYAETWAWGTSPPIAGLSITVSPMVPIPGQSAAFNSSWRGGVGPFTYKWRFGNGGSSTSANPSEIFPADGYYYVDLWMNDSAGHVALNSTQIYAYTPLSVPPIRATPNPATLGQQVNFIASATGGTPPYTFSWSFGDGTTGGNLTSITHIYTSTGRFTAQVTVTDSIGGVRQVNLTVSVGTSSGSGLLASEWFAVLLGASAVAIVVAAVLGAIVLRRRGKNRGDPSQRSDH